MRHFIKKIFYFFSSFFVLIIADIILIGFVNKQDYIYSFKEKTSIIYAGDSHIQLAINDSIIPNSKNIGNSSESYYLSYYKLKKLLNENPSIDTVYLGLSFHSLSSYYDEFVNGKYSTAVVAKYFYLLPFDEQVKFIKNTDSPLLFIKSITEEAFKLILSENINEYIGGFKSRFDNTKAVKSSMEKRLYFQYYSDNNKLKAFSELNINYLDKIIELCKSKRVNLYVLNTPLHSFYYEKVPKEYKQKLFNIVNTRKLKYIDLSQLKLTDNDFIPDGDHVSKIGANKTTIRLNELIKYECITRKSVTQASKNSIIDNK